MTTPTNLVNDEDIESHIYDIYDSRPDNLGPVERNLHSVDIDDVTIEQSLSLLYQHSTGGVVWNVTPVFAKWLQSSPLLSLVRNKTVVELGSGTGALAVLLSGIARRYLATDQHALLKLCRRNCESCKNVEVMEFDWEKHEFSGTDDTGVIISCDTIYNEHLIGPLGDAISSVLRSSPNITTVLFAVQHRELSLLELALKSLLRRFGSLQYYELAPGYGLYRTDQPNEIA